MNRSRFGAGLDGGFLGTDYLISSGAVGVFAELAYLVVAVAFGT